MNQTYVITKKADAEPFDPLKLHSSIVSACRAVRSLDGEAHSTAEQVCKNVIDWLAGKNEVTSRDIRRVASKHLETYQPEAAYLYQNEPFMI